MVHNLPGVRPTEARPQLVDIGECRSCGGAIGWVTLRGGRRQPVETEPRGSGEFALLRGGIRAHRLTPDQRFEPRYDGLKYVDHHKLCPVPSFRTAAWSMSSASRGVADDPFREERRRDLLAADRSYDVGLPRSR